MSALPPPLAPLAPHARHVVLAPYTALGAVIVPNLGLRLLFPRRDARELMFAVTNPVFKVVRLGASGLLLSVVRGSHRRYCGNVFIGLARAAVSLLVCTSDSGRHYASDIVFAPPRPVVRHPLPQPKRHRFWRRVAAAVAFGGAGTTIDKRRALVRRGHRLVLLVHRFLYTPHHAVLGFALKARNPRNARVVTAALYSGRPPWRHPGERLSCVRARRDTRCALACLRQKAPVRRWRLVVVGALGPVEVSW